MVEQVSLEILLVPGAVEDQPAGTRITEAVREGEIESEGDLVDEVVVIGLAAAVVIASEIDSSLVVKECPASKVNGVNPCKPPLVVKMAGTPVNDPEDDDRQPSPEETRFE